MSLLSLAIALVTPAQAGIYSGNPGIVVKVDRPVHDLTSADVAIDKLRVNYCGGGYTDYTVDAAVDLTVGYERTITGGDLCGVRVYWDSAMTIENGSFVLDYDSAYTDVYITTAPQPASLTPFTVVQGSISGGGPVLLIAFE